ncbi:thiol peroxidase [Mycoplasma sp. Mirounga ES2805-ORL]|uniref:thiol peroxidase n=1 Tax=Mycoplasma sp. Mirounga ES2805-ORL TaxID=754514 RepID=UPI00197B2F32|nr:thiol peroxidase [Mycoplasma sp. Mirounga ES2805-ORL]QSF13383.1 thiol peroxidase [Mycoplasma sp. Mirounga ES2805-ORL]
MKITFKGNEITLVGNQLKVGDVFPEFKAVGLNLSDFDYSSIKGKKKLIFSIPSIDTGVCEIETTKFMNYFKEKEDTPILVISYDLPFAFGRWCAASGNEHVQPLSEFKYNDFGVKTGTKIKELGLLTRAVFVVDENEKITHVEYVKEVGLEPNYKAVLKNFK